MTPTIIQSDREMAAEITALEELREIILSGRMDEHVNVQTIARARIAGWNAAVEAAANTGYVECAKTRHVTLGDKVSASIRNLRLDQEGKDDE